MIQRLHLANQLSSNCGMHFLIDQIWGCVCNVLVPPLPPKDTKAVQATGKLLQEITTALVLDKILNTFISLINFKKCIIWLSNFGVLCIALEPRNKKKVGQNWETRMIPDIVSKTETFSMKQSLNFANILSSICSIYFLIAIFQLHSGNLPDAVSEKLIQELQKQFRSRN